MKGHNVNFNLNEVESMTSIEKRINDELYHSAPSFPLIIAGGAFFGYAYATFAHLPAPQAAQAWAVWISAESILLSLGEILGTTEANRTMIKTVFFTFSSLIGIEELRKRGVMGDKVWQASVILRTIIIFGMLLKAVTSQRLQRNQTAKIP